MKALTIWQPWATLIIAGAKPYEFRRWDHRRRERALAGQRIVIHAGARPVRRDEVDDLLYRLARDGGKGTGLVAPLAREVLARIHSRSYPLASALGTAILGEPREASRLFAGDIADSDRVDHSIWAWPLTDIEPFEPPIPARGFQGFWIWNEVAP